MEQDLPDATPLMDADDIERALLGRPASMRRSEISQDVEVTPGSARRFWHALGFQIVEDEEAMFTEADREALQAVARLTHDLDVEEELALAMTRALARTADRLAVWQTQLMAEYVTGHDQVPDLAERDARAVENVDVARRAGTRLVELADEIEPLMVYAWRRHLASAITRMLADAGNDETPSAPGRVIGFADLVSFTTLRAGETVMLTLGAARGAEAASSRPWGTKSSSSTPIRRRPPRSPWTSSRPCRRTMSCLRCAWAWLGAVWSPVSATSSASPSTEPVASRPSRPPAGSSSTTSSLADWAR